MIIVPNQGRAGCYKASPWSLNLLPRCDDDGNQTIPAFPSLCFPSSWPVVPEQVCSQASSPPCCFNLHSSFSTFHDSYFIAIEESVHSALREMARLAGPQTALGFQASDSAHSSFHGHCFSIALIISLTDAFMALLLC